MRFRDGDRVGKTAAKVLMIIGIGVLVIGIAIQIFTIVWDPTLEGDHALDFEFDENDGQLTHNGKDLEEGDDVHIYGRVTEIDEMNPIPGSSGKYLALNHRVAVIIPYSIYDKLEDGDYISVKGEIRDFVTVEYVRADSYEVTKVPLEEICFGACGVDVIGIILIVVGVTLLGRAKVKSGTNQTPGSPHSGQRFQTSQHPEYQNEEPPVSENYVSWDKEAKY